MPLVKVTGTSFVRDTNSMALMNTDSKEKNEYLEKIRMINGQKEEINKVKAEIDSMREDMSEIKNLLLKLMDKE